MNRRAFIQTLSRSPIVATIAGKAITERAAMDLAGISTGLYGGGGVDEAPKDTGDYPKIQGKECVEPTPQQWKLFLNNKLFRSEVETLLYDDYRTIHRIDPDLAVLRSLSLNAKIAFQRQRIVNRELEQLGQVYNSRWGRIRRLGEKYLKLLF
jgi:hypothetical protein